FQPAQAVVAPENPDKFIGAGNQTYVTGLGGLQGAVAQIAQTPIDPSNAAAFAPVQQASTSAHGAALQTSQAFDSNTPVTPTVLGLLQAPINNVDELIRAQGPKQANGAGQSFCAAYAPLMSKFPFAPNGPDASVQEVAAILNPATGPLAQLNGAVKPLLLQQGSVWVANPTSPIKVTSEFLRFYNRLQSISALVSPATPGSGGLTFTIEILPSPVNQKVSFQLDNQVVSDIGHPKIFTWSPQTSQQAQITVGTFGQPVTGNWALLHLLASGEREQPAFPIRLDYRFGLVKVSTSTVRLELSPNAAMLVPGEFGPGRCVSIVAH
ncbi:MAG: hypothetical protein ACLGXA_24250, partial [Acidobacteriota bacterium]